MVDRLTFKAHIIVTGSDSDSYRLRPSRDVSAAMRKSPLAALEKSPPLN
jgi:hypothetical protein